MRGRERGGREIIEEEIKLAQTPDLPRHKTPTSRIRGRKKKEKKSFADPAGP